MLNEEFKKNVAIPYFKDIYKDLAAQSDAKSKGINKVSILNVSIIFTHRSHNRRRLLASSSSVYLSRSGQFCLYCLCDVLNPDLRYTNNSHAIFMCVQYSSLPGIIGERFFAVLDLNSSAYIDLKEFVHGLFKVYYSDTETKLKFAFDM